MTATAAVRERPILFSGPMVRAILDGSKTQTRRVVTDPPLVGEKYEPHDPFVHSDGITWGWMCGEVSYIQNDRRCPYGAVGDRLWVRETWGTGGYFPWPYGYRADGKEYLGEKWRPSIFMPRAACRLVLKLTDVRVERVQAISDEDAIAEGIPCAQQATCNVAREHFHDLWDSLNWKRGYGWNVNPWVWVLSFRRAEQQAVAA